MSELYDIDMLAAEYVLGTLDHDERAEVERRRHNEPELRAAIAAWTKRLAPLDEYSHPVAPSEATRDATRARLAVLAQKNASNQDATADVIVLRRRVGRWRSAAIAAMAAAATFAGLFFFNGAMSPITQQSYVAVFNEGDRQPTFMMSIDLRTRELTIRPINAGPLAGKSYELWIVSDDISLRSLGLLDSSERPTRKRLDGFRPDALRQATFGISVEPAGGSPVGRPTGQALHGKLIPATN